MGGANIARNLGLTSLDLVNQGANLATSAGNAAQRRRQPAHEQENQPAAGEGVRLEKREQLTHD